jgi:putative ABC transport system permease protein
MSKVLSFFLLHEIKIIPKPRDMHFTSYFKYAFKNIKAEMKISIIIMFGFLVSFLSTYGIYNYVLGERNYNSNISDGELIYRLEQKSNVMFSGQVGDCIKQNIPQVEKVAKLNPWNNPSVSKINTNENITVSGDIYRTEETWNDLFKVKVIEGDILNVFFEKNKIALSESTVQKMFGKNSIVGKKINLNHKFSKSQTLIVGAVYQDVEKNNSMRPIGIYSLKDDGDLHSKNYKSYSLYVKLTHKCQVNEVIGEINKVLKDEDLIENGEPVKLCRINDMHFSNKIENDYIEKGDITKSNYFILIAFVIYFISLINYFNFRFVLSHKRQRNLLINRAVGASKIDLLIVNYFENLILLIITTIISSSIILALHTALLEVDVLVDFIDILIYLLVFVLFTSTLITFLPYSLSGMKSVHYNKSFNSVISTIQFVIIFVLLVCTAFIYKHKEYLLSYSVGISNDNIITLQLNTDVLKKYNEITSEFKSHSQIIDITYASNEPNDVEYKVSKENGKQIKYGIWIVDNNFMSFFNIKSLDGKALDGNTLISSYNTIVNKKAFDKYNLELHKPIPTLWGKCKLSGVCENFNYESLHGDIKPLCLIYKREYCNVAYIKYVGNPGPVLDHLQKSIKRFVPELSFQYKFLEDTFSDYYKDEIYLLNMLSVFCIIAILVTIIGLLGLTNLIIQNRIKEIGIRKTNGANVFDVLVLINKSLFFKILIAFIVGSPFAYIILNVWLENFAYKTSLTWWYFFFAAMTMLILVVVTVSPTCIKASKTNPSTILRHR